MIFLSFLFVAFFLIFMSGIPSIYYERYKEEKRIEKFKKESKERLDEHTKRWEEQELNTYDTP